MSNQISAVSSIHIPTSNHVKRSSSTHHPTIWGDQFLNCVTDSKIIDASNEQQHEGLRQEVRTLLITNMKSEPSKLLGLIDAVQRLGVDYHFKSEIKEALQKIFDDDHEIGDLYTVALRFRLLRQHGIKVSSEIFKRFKESEGNFKTSITNDVLGMLSLYEAAHLSIRGEVILDDALAFATETLQSLLPELTNHLATHVSHSLNRPIRKCLPRLETRYYIDAYPMEKSYDETLLKFAKLDFNMLQKLHQKELYSVTKWWKSLDVATNLPYARDRLVELYFWMMGIYFEPQYSFARIMLTKIIGTLSFLDDTYDNYATFEEAEILTDAIQRWDIKAKDTLPEYMKLIYVTLLDLYNEYGENIASDEKPLYSLYYAKESLKRVMRAYLAEAKWREQDYVPTMEEYMDVSLITSCYQFLAINSFLGLGAIATKHAYEWILEDPKLIRASTIISRLMDDIMSHEFEQTRKHVASAVECYMKQYGACKEEIVKLFQNEIGNAWKDINEGCLYPTAVPMPLLECILNLVRAMDVIYKDEDGYTNSHIIKHLIASVLVDPVLL